MAQISKDDVIKHAITTVGNVRLLKQDFNQSLITFILTAHKNIKAVKKSVKDFAINYGNKIEVDGKTFYTFPHVNIISKLTDEQIKKLGAGFRSSADGIVGLAGIKPARLSPPAATKKLRPAAQ